MEQRVIDEGFAFFSLRVRFARLIFLVYFLFFIFVLLIFSLYSLLGTDGVGCVAFEIGLFLVFYRAATTAV